MEALFQAGVATPGTADSFIKAAHVTRTRWAHQVTAGVLYLLRQEGYTQYGDALDEGQVTVSVEDGCATRADTSPHAHARTQQNSCVSPRMGCLE